MHAVKAQISNFLRTRGISPAKATVFVLVALVVVYLLITSLQDSAPKPVATATAPSVVAATPEAPKIFVHVVGQVEHPGMYQLQVNSRVFDAITAAGGFSASADQSSVNLARVLADGEQIVVTKPGEQALSGGLGSAQGGMALINLNRASVSELDSLPGIGPAIASRIVDWRTSNGGFRKKEDLMNVKGIGQKLFANVKDLVTL